MQFFIPDNSFVIDVYNMFLPNPRNHVFYQLILSIEDDISNFAEVLDHILILNVTVNDDLVVIISEYGVFDEFFDEWVYNSVVLA
jgi:hypothetical protein